MAGWLVYVRLVLLHGEPWWDEAAHALQGALIAHDLRSGDLLAFLFDSYRQVYWPPMHSWLVGAAFLVTGPDLEVARGLSVLAYVLLAPTLFLLARAVEPRHGVLAGCLASALALTSPGLIQLASRSMLELPGLLAFTSTMLIYCRLEQEPDAPSCVHVLLGMGIVVTYLIKSNYGILLVLCIVLTQLVAAGFRLRALLTRRNLYSALPLVIFCAVWFAYPQKIVSTWNALVNQPYGGEDARGLAGLLFYPRLHVALSGSLWMSLILWSGLAMAWQIRDRPGTRFLALVALTLFVIGEFHHTKVYRHLLPMFPPMFVLTGVAGANLWARLSGRGRSARAAAVGLLVVLGILHATALGRDDFLVPRFREGADVVEYVVARVREYSPALVLGTREAWPEPPVMDWALLSAGLLPATAAGSAMDPRQERSLIRAVGHGRIPETLRSRVRRVLDRYDLPSAVRTLHVGDRVPEDPAQFEDVLQRTLESYRPKTIIAIVGTSGTTSYTVDFIAPGIARAGYQQVSDQEFPRAATRVYVYRPQ